MYRKGRIMFPGSVERPGFGDKFCTNAQVRLRTQLKLDANSVKRKRRILIINFERNFGRNSVIFVKNLLAWHFLLYFFIFLLSAQSKQEPTYKFLLLNKRPGRLNGHLLLTNISLHWNSHVFSNWIN